MDFSPRICYTMQNFATLGPRVDRSVLVGRQSRDHELALELPGCTTVVCCVQTGSRARVGDDRIGGRGTHGENVLAGQRLAYRPPTTAGARLRELDDAVRRGDIEDLYFGHSPRSLRGTPSGDCCLLCHMPPKVRRNRAQAFDHRGQYVKQVVDVL